MGVGIGVLGFLLFLPSAMNTGYKRGQIDCINGKVMVHKVTNKDQESVWGWINKPKYRRYFSHFECGVYYCFAYGSDEWASKGKTTSWLNCIAWEEGID